MKKITLLFSLMVALTATAFASQATANDEAEVVEFGLTSSFPQESEIIQAIYGVQLKFNKNITVTLPEAGLNILNSKGEVVINIKNARTNENMVIFDLLEEVVDKDGKTEQQYVTISTPDTYTLEVPKGVIKSVDGEDYEKTFTFIVNTPFDVTIVNFKDETDTPVGMIALQGTKDFTVTWPEGGLSVKDKDGNVVASITSQPTQPVPYGIMLNFDQKEVEGEDGKTELQPVQLSTPGTYTLEIPKGVIKSVDGEDYEKTFTFTIIAPQPVINISPNESESLTEIKEIVITISNAEVTFNAEKEVAAYLSGVPTVGDVSYDESTTTITISFEEPLTDEGDYLVSIPDGLYTINGEPNDAAILKYNITKIEPLEIKEVTPKEEEIGKIETITITFNQPIGLAWDENYQTPGQTIDLIDSKGNITELQCIRASGNTLVYAKAEWDKYDYVVMEITEPETYTLDLAQIFVAYGAVEMMDDYSGATWYEYKAKEYATGTYTWSVTGDTAVEGIEAEDGEQVIYDLTGRKVDNITNAGIYIVNGKKVMVK